jgi:hypothetical protein
MELSGHLIGLLKGYMRDLVDQAVQEAEAHRVFGFRPPLYGPDHAISDLLAILDDRIESEGMQVGLPPAVLHVLWMVCNEAKTHLADRVWLESNIGDETVSKARVRELTYRALIEYLEGMEGSAAPS